MLGIGVPETEKGDLSTTCPFSRPMTLISLAFSGLNDILVHPSASRQLGSHCQVIHEGPDWWLMDLRPGLGLRSGLSLCTLVQLIHHHVHCQSKQDHLDGTVCDDSHLQSVPLWYCWPCWDSQAEITVIIQEEVSGWGWNMVPLPEFLCSFLHLSVNISVLEEESQSLCYNAEENLPFNSEHRDDSKLESSFLGIHTPSAYRHCCAVFPLLRMTLRTFQSLCRNLGQ